MLKKYPKTAKVLSKYKMICAACQGAEQEKLRHAAQNHGVPIDQLVRDLKAAAKSGS